MQAGIAPYAGAPSDDMRIGGGTRAGGGFRFSVVVVQEGRGLGLGHGV